MAQQNFDLHSTSNSMEKDTTCCICIDNLAKEIVALDCCVHVYCAECIIPWVKSNKTCPLDRKTVSEICIEFAKQFLNFYLELKGINEEHKDRYLQKNLYILDGLRHQITKRLHSENHITTFLDPDGIVLNEDTIKLYLYAIKQSIMTNAEILG